MTRPRKSAPKGLGRVPHWDPQNDAYRIRDVLPSLAPRRAAAAQRTQRYWDDRAWWGDQGATNACTAYSLVAFMADGPVTHRARPIMEPAELYRRIQTIDVNEGRDFGPDGGATMLAQQKAAKALGWIGEYRWGTTLEELVQTVLDVSPVLIGVNWYSDMLTPDRRGWIRVAGPLVGGHAIVVNGVNTKSATLRLKNSWSQLWGKRGHCYLSFDDMDRLIREDGEVVLAREMKS